MEKGWARIVLVHRCSRWLFAVTVWATFNYGNGRERS
jgi:hypothetical protein